LFLEQNCFILFVEIPDKEGHGKEVSIYFDIFNLIFDILTFKKCQVKTVFGGFGQLLEFYK